MVKIVQASRDEHGQYVGGQAGDQDGYEVYKTDWYAYGWTHYALPPAKYREKLAKAAEAAAANDHIGYDMYERNTILEQWHRYKSIANIKKNCETDCSALAGMCAIEAGLPEGILFEGNNLPYTGSMYDKLHRCGVSITCRPEYLNNPDNLTRGGILWNDHHCVVVVSSGKNKVKYTPAGASRTYNGKWHYMTVNGVMGVYGSNMDYFSCNCKRYRVMDWEGHWWGWINQYDPSDLDYGAAGIGKAIKGIAIDDSRIEYRVHLKGKKYTTGKNKGKYKWEPWVPGDGKLRKYSRLIDKIQIRLAH